MKQEKIIILFLLIVFPLLTGCGAASSVYLPNVDSSIFHESDSIYPVEELIYQSARNEMIALNIENRTVNSSISTKINEELIAENKDEKLLLDYKLENPNGNIMVDSSQTGLNLSFDNIKWKKSGIDISKLYISDMAKKFQKIAKLNSIFNEDKKFKKLMFKIEPEKDIDFYTFLNYLENKKDSKIVLSKSIDEIIDEISDKFYISNLHIEKLKELNLNSKKSYLVSLISHDDLTRLFINGKLLIEVKELNSENTDLIGVLGKFKYSLPIVVENLKLYTKA
jgi:hypothetical protein